MGGESFIWEVSRQASRTKVVTNMLEVFILIAGRGGALLVPKAAPGRICARLRGQSPQSSGKQLRPRDESHRSFATGQLRHGFTMDWRARTPDSQEFGRRFGVAFGLAAVREQTSSRGRAKYGGEPGRRCRQARGFGRNLVRAAWVSSAPGVERPGRGAGRLYRRTSCRGASSPLAD